MTGTVQTPDTSTTTGSTGTDAAAVSSTSEAQAGFNGSSAGTAAAGGVGAELNGLTRRILLEVARVVLARPAMAAQVADGLTPEGLLERGPEPIVQLLVKSAKLRAAVAARTGLVPAGLHAGAPVTDDAVARGLLCGDTSAAAAAAVHVTTALAPAIRVGTGVTSTIAGAPVAPAPVSRRRDSPAAEDKQVKYAERKVTEAKAAAARMRGQLTHAHTERDEALSRAKAAGSDLDDTRAELVAARSDVTAARRQAGDVRHAARMLLTAIRPAPAQARTTDPREAEQQLLTGTSTSAASTGLVPADPALAAAAAQSGVELTVVQQLLEALLTPAVPEPVSTAPGTTRQREFVVTPLGGGESIGGSCILVEVGEIRILVDAGIRPKARLSDCGPPDIDQAFTGRIDAIVITHAHNDHAGYVPAVVAAQPHIPVFTTSGTAALLATMWADSITVFGHLSREAQARAAAAPTARINGGEWSSSDLLDADRAPYTEAEWRAAHERVQVLDLGRAVTIRGGVTLEMFPAGHVLGACGVVIGADGNKVTVTGDVSDLQQASVPGLVVPDAAVGSDLLVIESTYCRRPDGMTRANAVEAFLSTVRETIDGGGRVLVPAFALGRAQEVALLMRERLPDVPVLIDGMAKTVSEIYEQQTADTDRPLFIFGDNVARVKDRMRTIETFRRGVIVTTSGMLAAGPAIPWARSVLPDPKSALLVAGYQDEESPGAELLRLADDTSAAGRKFQLQERPVAVEARVAKFSLSAHADRTGLTSIIDEVAPDRIMLVHGNPHSQRDYRDVLKARGNTSVPTGVWAAP